MNLRDFTQSVNDDNAPCHVAIMKGSLSTIAMNVSDGGKQPILTQNGC